MRSLRAPAVLGLIAVVAVLCAGCGTGSGGDDESAATAPASTVPAGATGSGGTKTASAHAKAVRFAECMRAHGVSGFPDPDASGTLTIDGVVNGSSVDPNSAAWKGALTACKGLEPPGFTGSKATPAQMTARLRFAQCVRDNGVKDFPDPAADAPLVNTDLIPSSATDAGMSALNAAMRKCSSFASAAGVRAGP